MNTTQRSIMWFRRDLRLLNNAALHEATWAGPALAVFVVDPAFREAGPARRAVLAGAIRSLNASLTAIGGELVIRHGDPREEVPNLAAEIGASRVFVTRDTAPYGRSRDAAVSERLAQQDVELVEVGSPYVVRPGSILKADGSPYSVFSAYWRRWVDHVQTELLGIPDDPEWLRAPSDGIPDASPEVLERTGIDPSEAAAWRRWDEFVSRPADGLAQYEASRDYPASDGTSRMSAYLKFGILHPRQLLADLDDAQPGHAAFGRELAWRDFYADVLFHHPEAGVRNLNRYFDKMQVDSGPSAVAKFQRWCTGQTGFPIVDAGMRQLVRTGWMHNRVRMIVASFLVKDLHLPWQWGARYFMQHLVDGDIASNSQGWQWAAGSGTDAAPYFRVFNPDTQLRRWDPDATYVRRWLPEFGTDAYDAPMLDHGAERHEALHRYAATRADR